jgi:response regulator of citrate/malate metabolism
MNAESQNTKALSPQPTRYQTKKSRSRALAQRLDTVYDQRRKEANALAKRIHTLTKKFPGFKFLLEDVLLSLRHQTTRSLVLHRIHIGYWTVEQLTRETKLPESEVRRILEELVQAQIVFTTKHKYDTDKGGRPEIMYQLQYLPEPNRHL